MTRLSSIVFTLVLIFFCACTSDNYDDLINSKTAEETIIPTTTTTSTVQTTTSTNTTTTGNSAISLSKDIVPLFNKYNCLVCHSRARQDGGINVETYTALKVIANNGRLYGAVSYNSRYVAMPEGVKMTTAELAIIDQWIKQGALNN